MEKQLKMTTSSGLLATGCLYEEDKQRCVDDKVLTMGAG
jgi:hypothetical protein